MIPQLRDLEQQFPNELVVVGVHSGKYTAERDTARIRDASIRLGNTHPVVNDRQFRVWRSYAVNAWPTIVIVSPTGYVVGQQAGEFTAEMIAPAIEQLIAACDADGTLDRTPRHFEPDPPVMAPGLLRYPGKVIVDGDRIAIADTGHGRVLAGTLDSSGTRMRVARAIGQEGPWNAESRTANTFIWPLGMAWKGDTLFVADAGHHAVFAAELDGPSRMIAGTGHQIRVRADLTNGSLSSPWDVALAGDTLYIASAGSHQIHSLDLAGASLDSLARDPAGRARRLRVHAGTRREDIADGPNAGAALAQPMAIAAAAGRLYFADAETSAIRWCDTDAAGDTHTLVGTGLFDFGDKDGAGDDVRMQHQQGVAARSSGQLLIADSYNDALKWLDPATRRADVWVRGLHEPGGVSIGKQYAYVADTNAHRVMLAHLETGELSELEIENE
ncbi:MAG: alkyl hydroperoxide reductase [Gemmatimonadaceae bacterium]